MLVMNIITIIQISDTDGTATPISVYERVHIQVIVEGSYCCSV